MAVTVTQYPGSGLFQNLANTSATPVGMGSIFQPAVNYYGSGGTGVPQGWNEGHMGGNWNPAVGVAQSVDPSGGVAGWAGDLTTPIAQSPGVETINAMTGMGPQPEIPALAGGLPAANPYLFGGGGLMMAGLNRGQEDGTKTLMAPAGYIGNMAEYQTGRGLIRI